RTAGRYYWVEVGADDRGSVDTDLSGHR
ncbi:MAG: hypothetical protein QOH82_3309, partial [Mycobacterium sp.]|nr:hypothetical protein [Mycobacterium sp.]